MYKLAVFDVAGTVVSDNGVVLRAFEGAFKEVVPQLWESESESFIKYAVETMGRSKIQVFEHLLESKELAQLASDRFQKHYVASLGDVQPIAGIEQLFHSLRENGVAIALNTGFNRPTLDKIISTLGWEELVSASATVSETGVGRPDPAMLTHVSKVLGTLDPAEVAVLGDTASDMEAAAAFGASLKIGVLSGAHSYEQLQSAGADLILQDATLSLDALLD